MKCVTFCSKQLVIYNIPESITTGKKYLSRIKAHRLKMLKMLKK